jgi:hypothetical protein
MTMSHDMIHERSLRSRVISVAIALVLAMAAVAVVHPWSARASSGSAGPATVTVTPSSGLNNGDAVDITATFAAGSVFKMTAHLCLDGGTYNNNADFALDGPWCSPNAVSPQADVVKTVNVAPSDTSASIATATGNPFHVGVGTAASWQDFNFDTHQLTCGPSTVCDLVVEVAISGGNAFFVVPLGFAGAVTTTTAGPTTTTAGPTTTTAGPTTTTAAPTTTTAGATTTTAKATTTTSSATTTTGGSTTTLPVGGTATTGSVIVAGAGAQSAGSSSALALTGASSRDLASAALLLLAAGLLLLSASKRRAPES